MAFDKDKAAIGVTLFGPMGVALGETTIRNPCKETDTSYTTHTVRENANFELNNRVYSKDFIIQSGILKKYMGNSEVLLIENQHPKSPLFLLLDQPVEAAPFQSCSAHCLLCRDSSALPNRIDRFPILRLLQRRPAKVLSL